MISFVYYILIQKHFRKFTSVLIRSQIPYSGLGQLLLLGGDGGFVHFTFTFTHVGKYT